MAKKLSTFSMRMPEDINDRIQAYAEEHECTKAEAMSHFARAGMKLEDEGPQTVQAAADGTASQASKSGATSADVEKIMTELQGLTKATESLRSASLARPAQDNAIVPVDIREKIQSYASAHSCTPAEALGYYARLGIQISDEARPASVHEVAELSKKLDVLAKDSQVKSEQIKQMSEAISAIKKNTEPETVEVEGELADPAIEEAHNAQLTDEEKQRQEAERTRKIMTDVMNEYAAAHPTPAPEPQPAQQQMNPWVPVLVAVIVSLVIGIIVLVLH